MEELITRVYKGLYDETPFETKLRLKAQRNMQRCQGMLHERIVHCQDIIALAKQVNHCPVFKVREDTPEEARWALQRLAILCSLWFLDFCFFLHYEAEVLDGQGRFHHKDILWFLFLYKKLATGAWAPYCKLAKRIKGYLAYKGYNFVWPRAK